MVAGSCKPSDKCTDTCLKAVKQCVCFLYDRPCLGPCHCITFYLESSFIVSVLLFSSLPQVIRYIIHFITVVEKVFEESRVQAGSFWIHDERMLPGLFCSPNQSIKFLI